MNKTIKEYLETIKKQDDLWEKIYVECKRVFGLLYKDKYSAKKLEGFIDSWRLEDFSFREKESLVRLEFESNYGCGCCPRDENYETIETRFLFEDEEINKHFGEAEEVRKKKREARKIATKKRKEKERIKKEEKKKEDALKELAEYERLKEKFE